MSSVVSEPRRTGSPWVCVYGSVSVHVRVPLPCFPCKNLHLVHTQLLHAPLPPLPWPHVDQGPRPQVTSGSQKGPHTPTRLVCPHDSSRTIFPEQCYLRALRGWGGRTQQGSCVICSSSGGGGGCSPTAEGAGETQSPQPSHTHSHSDSGFLSPALAVGPFPAPPHPVPYPPRLSPYRVQRAQSTLLAPRAQTGSGEASPSPIGVGRGEVRASWQSRADRRGSQGGVQGPSSFYCPPWTRQPLLSVSGSSAPRQPHGDAVQRRRRPCRSGGGAPIGHAVTLRARRAGGA